MQRNFAQKCCLDLINLISNFWDVMARRLASWKDVHWWVSCLVMGFHGNAQARLRHLSYAAPVFVDITRSVYQVNNVTSSEPESLQMDRAYAVYDRAYVWAYLLWCVLICIDLYWFVLICIDLYWFVLICIDLYWFVLICIDLSTDALKTTCLICLILSDSVCESAPRMVKGHWSRRTLTPRCFSCACRSWSGRSARQVCHKLCLFPMHVSAILQHHEAGTFHEQLNDSCHDSIWLMPNLI